MIQSEKVLYDYAMRMVGLPYRWGGDDSIAGFDCSGLCLELLKAAGVAPLDDMTAQGLFNFYRDRADYNKKALGSLAFYGRSTSEITHVAYCVNSSLCIEAGGGGSKTTSVDAAIQQNAFIRVRPIEARKDLVFVLRPLYRLID